MFTFNNEYINEETARRAKENISFSDYKPGSATAQYTAQMEALKEIAEEYARKSKYIESEPERIEEAQSYINYYGRKYAEYINKDNEITCRCPSVMIAGPANFPVRKKQKQVAAWEANSRNYISLDDARYKLRYILLQEHPINGSDPDAIEKLKAKLERLEKEYNEEKAEIAALAPGTGTTGMFSSSAARTKNFPGSLTAGVPASLIRAMFFPLLSSSIC